MKKNKGFTLIELFVVIAIIGILASVVLASLNTARDKGANASVKSNLNNMRAQAELVYDNASPNSYATVCSDANVTKALEAARVSSGALTTTVAFATAETATSVACQSQSTSWVIQAPLKGTGAGYWCVDSSGKSQAEAAVLPASSATCV